MTILATIDQGVPVSPEAKHLDLEKRTAAAANTALELEKHGLELTPNTEDKDIAAKLTVAYADNPEKTSKKVTARRASTLTPASLVLTNKILNEFGRSVAESAVQIRHLVTNKLLLETESSNPQSRIRALELLGKISDVGLFSEKSEVTITHQSTDDLKAKLRQKLEKLVNPTEEIEDVVIIDGEPIDVDAELGFEDEEDERS